jgi:hypothetical protein
MKYSYHYFILLALGLFIAQGTTMAQSTIKTTIFGDPQTSLSKNVEQVSRVSQSYLTLLFNESKKTEELLIENVNAVKEAKYFSLNEDELAKLIELKPSLVTISLTSANGKAFNLSLVKYQVLADDFKAGKIENGEHIETSFQPGLYYRGVILGEKSGWATLSITTNSVQGIIAGNDGNWVLGKLKNNSEYVFYNDRDLKAKNPFECGSFGTENDALSVIKEGPKAICPLQVWWVGDYDVFIQSGGLTSAQNNIISIFNNVATLYQAEGLSVSLGDLYIHTTPDNYSETDSWAAFHAFGGNVHTSGIFDEDLAMLLALNINGNGQSYGIIDALCSNYIPNQGTSSGRYAYSRIDNYWYGVPVYSWTVSVATHEMGHNLGSRHTHWCGWPGGAIDNCAGVEPDPFGNFCAPGPFPSSGGTIMSYCHTVLGDINFNNGFGFYPNQEILSDVENASPCLCVAGLSDVVFDDISDLFELSPNPTSGEFQIDFHESLIPGEFKVTVIDNAGRILIDAIGTSQLNLATFPEGIYMIRVESKTKIGVKKLIKI